MKARPALRVALLSLLVPTLGAGAADAQWRCASGAKTTPADGQAGDNFGRSVDLEESRIVVGAHWEDQKGNNAGAAYVFRRVGTQWVEEQKLVASDGQANDRFGVSVSIEGTWIGVGAWREDAGGALDAGAAYFYRFDGSAWGGEQKLTASDGDAEDNFGRHVCLSGDVALIGAYHDETAGANAGSAYAFRLVAGTWTEEQKLRAPDRAAGDEFGWATYVLGDVGIVGAPLADAAGVDAGAAYVYRHDGLEWVFERKVLASDARTNEYFGYSIGMRGRRAVVAAPVRLSVVGGPGSCYVFEDAGDGAWNELEKIEPSDGAAQDAFGFFVSMDEHTVLTGSWRDDDAGEDSGSAYFYTCRGKRVALGPERRPGSVTRAALEAAAPRLVLEGGELVLEPGEGQLGTNACWVGLWGRLGNDAVSNGSALFLGARPWSRARPRTGAAEPRLRWRVPGVVPGAAAALSGGRLELQAFVLAPGIRRASNRVAVILPR